IQGQVPPLTHQDSKPSSLLIRTLDNQITVVDFGAAKKANTLPGTYSALEVYKAAEPDQGFVCPQKVMCCG
ncbi:MAG TPA: hypothetical protein V6D03_02180, partial [Candidatus Caenarcaniphilales bacterium]